ncbi:MAG: M42 family metallopeptidase [Clostridiales bacterium]|nr:M42 family metallopeptidase [Clostridiales bacterium]
MDLKQLTDLHGPSGNERAVRRAIVEAAKPLADEVKIDRSGNVICLKKGTNPDKPAVMVAAHMDEVGFIIAGYTEEGLLRFRPVGGIDPRVIVSKWVAIGDDNIPGVIGALAIHLQSADDRKRVLKYNDLYIDIGAKDQKEAEKLCPLGTYAAFDTPYAEFGDGFVCAKALDDRVGCYNLLRLLEDRYPGDLYCCFVTQEEIGLRGSQGAAYHVPAGIGIALEGTAAGDLGDVKEQFHITRPGQGVAVSFMDRASIADRELYRQVLALAEGAGIRHQIKQGVTGGNDAGSLQVGGGGRKTIVFSVPCRYIHSGASVAKLSDIDDQLALTREYLNNL